MFVVNKYVLVFVIIFASERVSKAHGDLLGGRGYPYELLITALVSLSSGNILIYCHLIHRMIVISGNEGSSPLRKDGTTICPRRLSSWVSASHR